MPRSYNKKTALSKRQYAAVARVANKQIHKQSELKVFNGINASYIVRSTPSIVKIDPPAQGSGANSRDGDSIYMKSLAINASLSPDTVQNMTMRVILFQWLENDVTQPVATDILADTANFNQCLHSFYVTNPQKQFKVLDDRLVYFDSQNASNGKPYRVRVKAGDMAIRKPDFDAAAITGRGNFYFLLVSSSATDGTLRTPLSRLRYFDN